MNRKAFKATMLAAALCLGAFATPALAQISLSIDIGIPPPPSRYEAYEEPRPGFILIPGYWLWDGRQHQWHERRWERTRPGQRWAPARWEDRGDMHHFEPGRWEPAHRAKRPMPREAHGRGNPGRGDPGHGNPGMGHGGNDNDGPHGNPGRGPDRR